ncbi:uncharacterized protein LOC126571746 isoform X1 [Anopheles aquasalis]|uniref:uncharacterized protein LOC126571746 isoform X1 n=1 Tax=Anopheles aquasalis TaxID=42839 RepID=UPI00215A0F04|nr:uncharacterized protein LOC126571746 isoform X1 [Anopheles aquasalis]
MFLIVEIVNDKGEKDWKVAPKRWVCTSKNTQRPVLFWPHEFSAERQNQLAIEGTCKPLQSWMRRECVVRQEFPTYEEAQNELHAPLKHKEQITEEEPEKLLNVEDASVESPGSPCASGSDEDASTLASIKSMLQSLITNNARIEEQSANILEQNCRIAKEMSLLQKRVETVESKFINTTTILCSDTSWHKPEAAVELNCKPNHSGRKFSFKPTETMEQLLQLDTILNDESLYTELVQGLLSKVDDDNAIWRMKSCVDLLCTLELQSKLKWSGISRLPNFLNVFKEVGKTPSENVTLASVTDFFKGHLKNTKQRYLISLSRKRASFRRKPRRMLRLGNDQQAVSSSFTFVNSADPQTDHSVRAFTFQPMETTEQLQELEAKLNDESFNAQLVQWLLSNVNDDNTPWRMKRCVNLLCSLELQTNMTWSRKHNQTPKEPIVDLPNFLNLFKIVGKTPSESVTDRSLVLFFKNHLKNSKVRFLISLNRKRASSWKRLKRLQEPKDDVADNEQEFIVEHKLSDEDIIIYDPIE